MTFDRREVIAGILAAGLTGGGYLAARSLDSDSTGNASESPAPERSPDMPTEAHTETREQGQDWQRVAAVVLQLGVPTVAQRGSADGSTAASAGTVLHDPATGRVSVSSGADWEPVATPSPRPVSSPPSLGSLDRLSYVDPAAGAAGLREALDALGSAPGTVVVDPGRIDDIDGNVEIPSNTHLRGTSAAETTLAFADGADLPLSGLLRIEGENVVVSDLELDGNRANVELGRDRLGQEYGVYTSGARDVTVERVYCHHFPGYGFDPHAADADPSRAITITDCVAAHNGLDGFTFAGVTDGLAINNCSIGNDRHGFAATDTEGAGTEFRNNVAIGNGAAGAVVQNEYADAQFRVCLLAGNHRDGVRIGNTGERATGVTVADSLIRHSGRYGANLRASRTVEIRDCRFEANNRTGSATAVVGLTSDTLGAAAVRIVGNRLSAMSETRYGIDEREGNGPTTVRDNEISGVEEAVRLTHPQSVE